MIVHATQQLPTTIARAPLQPMTIAGASFPTTYATPTLPAHESLNITMPPVPPHPYNGPSSKYLPLQGRWRPETCTSL